MKEDQAKNMTLIADIRRPVRKLLDDYLTIGPFSSSETMQNDGKKSESAGEGQNERKLLKIRAKNGANARNRTEDLFITRCKAYLLPIVNIEVVTVFF